MKHLLFSELLNKLFLELEKCRSPLIANFNQGIDRSEINKLLEPLGLKIPDALTTFFEWKNGLVEEDKENYPLGCFSLFSLASPISIQVSIDIYRYYAIDNGYWDARYFPIFESGLGDYFLLDINCDSPTYKMVCFFSPANPYVDGVVSYADSLESLVETVVECYRKQIYYFKEFEGNWVFDELALPADRYFLYPGAY